MLGTPSSYLAGNRVYRGGFPNPNSGTVNPSGYIARENKNQRRSGLAQTALRLQQKNNQTAAPTSHISTAVSPSSHTTQTTATGKIQLVPLVSGSPTDASNVLPFDPQTSAQQLLLQKQNDDFMNNLQQGQQKLAEDITTKERGVDLAAPGQYRQLLNNYASRGMANSSGYGYQYGVTSDDIANQKADLERQLQEGLAQYNLDAQQQQDNYNLSLGQLQTGSAEGMTPDQYAGLSGAQLPQVKKPAPKPPVKTPAKKNNKKANQAAAARLLANKAKQRGKL